jgi:hypothetical protein
MRALRTVVVVLVVASLCAPMTAAGEDVGRRKLARETESPPGQIVVITANARQARVLDVVRFKRLLALVEAVRTRPPAFDGGFGGAITAPDVILLQEMTLANVEIFRRLYNQRSDFRYEIVSTNDSNRKFLVNSQALTLAGEPASWDNPCRDSSDPRGPSKFLKAAFVENESGVTFTMAGVHYPKKNPAGQTACKDRNTVELRNQLASASSPILIGGDFNSRPVQQWRECDPNEQTTPLDWYTMMTAPSDGGHIYIDAVRRWNRDHGATMEHSWTHEWEKTRTLCNGRVGLQRSRIDYLFASGAQVIEARADHPGWAGEKPGSRDPEAFRYSDHRFVYGRFLIGATARASRPELEALRGGDVEVSWEPVEGATSYLLYRALRGHSYSLLQRLDATSTSFRDFATEHDASYRYAVAAIGADGSQGAESPPARISVDARGPRVKSSSPRPGATGVARGAVARVRFDENVAASSVQANTMELWRNGRRVPGRTIRSSARVLTFNPRGRLAKRETYRVVVKSVRDRFGNSGPRYSWRFTTRR